MDTPLPNADPASWATRFAVEQTRRAHAEAALTAAEATSRVLEQQLAAATRQTHQLAEQKRFFETILAHLPKAVAVLDADFRYVFINPAAEPDPVIRQWLVGKTNLQACQRRHYPAHIAQQRQRAFNEARQQQREVTWEETLSQGSQPRQWLRRFRPVLHPDGALQFMIHSGLDITARHAAEQRQRQSEALMREQQAFTRLVMDTLPNKVYVAAVDGTVSFANAAYAAARQEAVPASGSETHGSEVPEPFRDVAAWDQQVRATQQPFQVEQTLAVLPAGTRYLQVDKRPLVRGNGAVEVLTIETDITALKVAQQAAEANACAKEVFLSRMSHEIRTPLNGVLGMATLLAKTELTSAQHEYLHTMQRAGQHLVALVNDVLDMAKITTQPLSFEEKPFDVAFTLQGAQQLMAALAEEKGLPLLLTAAPVADSHVLGDAYRLHQVLLNLLSNAIKFTEQGHLELGMDVVEDTRSTLTLRFWVTDTGIGIAPPHQQAIFEAFTQVSSAQDRLRGGGVGLGLAISQQVVRQMGGELEVRSALEQGSTFFFTLSFPRATVAPVPPVAEQITYPELRGLRVLLAEDNLVNQWLATVMLEHWGVQVDAVDNGPQALARLQEQAYDVAILDIQMPGLTGLEVTRAIRQHAVAARAQVPILALTANAFQADRESYLAAGMSACLTKPFVEAELCRLLGQLRRVPPAT
ncbi:PAS domain-containing hybrid sensor histidine kinase/response regulator [Hymenobacter crusticola]|uniref:histidine kinase n=1 Tax=Hymenobacter crusticola TaxID=1770526 RepID=A0A243W6A7_9BACT|nr:PAS domain-containing sensor histidine kinase [Hymenobacter crusticola]OUJ69491.1 hypothetical protein BXP70_26260 [Hymenobacter crusticola]